MVIPETKKDPLLEIMPASSDEFPKATVNINIEPTPKPKKEVKIEENKNVNHFEVSALTNRDGGLNLELS